MTDDSVEFLSVEKLAAISVKTGLFSKEAQARLLGKDGDFAAEANMVKALVPSMRNIFTGRMRKAGAVTGSAEMNKWEMRINELEKRAGIDSYSKRCIGSDKE